MKFITESPFCAFVETLGDPVLVALFCFMLLSAHVVPANLVRLHPTIVQDPIFHLVLKFREKYLRFLSSLFSGKCGCRTRGICQFPIGFATGLLVVPVVKLLLVGAHTPPGAPSLNALTR